MISFHECPDLSSIRDLKAQYLQSLVAPMDGMWDVGFTNASPHWEIKQDRERVGYYALNDEGAILQFYVIPDFQHHGRSVLDEVIARESVSHAVVATIDPLFLSLCLDKHDSVSVHTLMYELRAQVQPFHPEMDGIEFRLLDAPDLERTIAFQQDGLGGDHDLSNWLRGYSRNLIRRNELFVLCREDEWLGLGERRKSDTQTGVADLGMMVTPQHRKKGWGTHILCLLNVRCTGEGLRAICSTTVDNLGAQIAISRAGFTSRHRIMNVTFK